MNATIEWLLDGPAWVEYRTRVDLLSQSELDVEVVRSRQAMIQSPQVVKLVADLQDWPGIPVNSHKKADLPMHKLAFLAELGLNANDSGMDTVIDRILDFQSVDGPFQVRMVIPKAFGGSGNEILAWALCDAPLTLYSLIKFGLTDHPKVQRALQSQIAMIKQNGYPCLGSREMGTFRGPGRKEDPCPFATLIMLKVFSALPNGWEIPAAQIAAQSLLELWTHRLDTHPYMFYMGTDFNKLKGPLNWYDLLHVCDILTRFPELRTDPAVIEMAKIIKQKMDSEGKVTPESVYLAWKDWDFGQKKEPSQWLTFLAHRILMRMASNLN